MPSYKHELLLLLFRNSSASAADLLRNLEVPLPEYDAVRTESSDLSDLKPAEYRADLVLFLMRGAHKELGIVVEVQLRRDEDKPYVWPAYIANLRARHRCPVCLLVVTVEDTVARWAGQSIDLGPGSRCNPWVVGPTNTPAITELQDAQENVELAVLSVAAHGKDPDTSLALRIASTAMLASADIDTERSRLYFDLIQMSLPDSAPEGLEAIMNSLGYEYQGAFSRRYFGEGKLEGRAEGLAEGRAEGLAEGRAAGLMEGRLEVVLKLLESRFGPLTETAQARVRSAQPEQLDALISRILAVQTPDEALDALRAQGNEP